MTAGDRYHPVSQGHVPTASANCAGAVCPGVAR